MRIAESSFESEETRIIAELPVEAEAPAPMRLRRMTVNWLSALTLLIAIPFGAVHGAVYLPIYTLTALLAAGYCIFGTRALDEAFRPKSVGRFILLALSLFTLYVAAQGAYASIATLDHPVLGRTSSLLDQSTYYSSLFTIVFFLASFILVRTVLTTEPDADVRFRTLAIVGGVLVALIGLAHWFYDNGKLFWVFEPNNVFYSPRARWPFVNANHLGHFLLPVFFLCLSALAVRFRQFSAPRRDPDLTIQKMISRFAESSRQQWMVVLSAFTLFSVFGVLVAILASLSRSTWIGLCVGALCYFLLSRVVTKAPKERPVPLKDDSAERPSSRHRRRRRSTSNGRRETSISLDTVLAPLRKIGRPAILILALVVFLLFLSERGSDLIASRIDYGLAASKDDIRWTMYEETLSIVRENPLFGVGMGGWEQAYSRFRTPLLAGLRPVYAHSEPVQLLAETGVIGFSLIAALVICLLRYGWRTVSRLGASPETAVYASHTKGIIAGLLALVVGTFFDFTFRMPAITFMVAVYVALLSYYIDQGSQKPHSQG